MLLHDDFDLNDFYSLFMRSIYMSFEMFSVSNPKNKTQMQMPILFAALFILFDYNTSNDAWKYMYWLVEQFEILLKGPLRPIPSYVIKCYSFDV